MRIRTFVVSALACVSVVVLAASAVAQSDPIVGTWKTNVAKSKYSPGPAPKSATLVITAEGGGYKVVTDTVPATGAATHTENTWSFDGKDHPVKGNPNVDTSSYAKVDARTYTVTSKKAGKVAITARVVISADGKTRTTTQTGTTADGKPLNNTIVAEK